MRKRLALSLFFSLLAAMPYAHSQISSGASTQDQSSDCSDPVNAMSAACSSAQSQQFGLGNYGQFGNYGQTGESNIPSGAPLGSRGITTYNDLGLPTTATTPQNRNLQPLTTPAPPEQLTEFQKFIAGTTSEVLPIFGANLFSNVPSTFAPVDQIPVTPDYIIGPDDELRIRIWGQVNFNANVRVDRSGSIYLPQVGAVHVAGLPFSALYP